MAVIRKTKKPASRGKLKPTKAQAARKTAAPTHAGKKSAPGKKQIAPPPGGNLLERVGDGFVAFDAKMNYTYVNRKGAEMLGHKPRDLVGKNYWKEFPEAKGTPFAKAYQRALKTQETLVIEDYYAPWDRWFENRIYPSKDGLSVFFTEITERKKAEQTLREAQERLTLAIRSANVGLWDWDLQTNKVRYSPEWKKQLGYEEIEITDDFSEWETRVHPEDLERAKATVGSYIEKPYPNFQNEFRMRHKDGMYRWILAQASLLCDERGKPIRMIGSHIDITGRKRDELLLALEARILEMISLDSTLAEALEKIVLSIEAMTDETIASILLLDSDGMHVHYGAAPHLPDAYNRALEGAPIGPAEGSCGTAAYRREAVIVTDIATDPLWKNYRELALAHGLRACWSTPIISREGIVLGTFAMYYREPRSPREQDFALIARVTHLADIAIVRKRAQEELQRGERVLRLFVENSPAAIAMFDREMRYIVASRRYLIDYDLGEQDVVGHSHYEIFPEIPERWKEIHRRCLAGAIERAEEDPFPRLSGKLDWIRWEIRPWHEMDGGIGGVILFSEVITERKQAEDELRLSRDRLAGLSRRLSEIREREARAIGRELHDQIGQMLTALKLTLEIAPQFPPEQASKKLAGAQELLDDLMSRVSALSLELRPPMLDDLGLIPALTWQVNRFQEQSGIAMEFMHSGVEGKRFAREIETAAYRIVQESLTNVARHARATRARLEVRERSGWLEIKIEDDGAGFDPESAFAKNRGLSGMRERALLVGGAFQVESQPGKGARKFVRLPAREEMK